MNRFLSVVRTPHNKLWPEMCSIRLKPDFPRGMYIDVSLQVRVLLIWQRHSRGVLHLLLVLSHGSLVDLDLWWGKGGRGDELLNSC
jgi:hypothetical protein